VPLHFLDYLTKTTSSSAAWAAKVERLILWEIQAQKQPTAASLSRSRTPATDWRQRCRQPDHDRQTPCPRRSKAAADVRSAVTEPTSCNERCTHPGRRRETTTAPGAAAGRQRRGEVQNRVKNKEQKVRRSSYQRPTGHEKFEGRRINAALPTTSSKVVVSTPQCP